MAENDIALMAHLMRRAGFGASYEDLEEYCAKGYEATVEELLHPELAPPALDDDDLYRRYHVDANQRALIDSCQAYWIYRMIHTTRPLEEKTALFWHNIFATGYTKLNQPKMILRQVDMFRRLGLGSFHPLLVELSRDPAMIFWLDNNDNHGGAVNENFGRELLELFSMGQGNYTETDVREASRAFTGWTIKNSTLHIARAARDSVWPYGRLDWQFEYQGHDHDQGNKSFLGNTGEFNGTDIIDAICKHPATARFIARHMSNFFVVDEVQVPSWKDVPPRDPEAIDTLAKAFVDSNYVIGDVMRVLFNSDFFKNASFARVKSPVEFVVGTLRLSGGHNFPEVADSTLGDETKVMGQALLDPPSVEGWHTGAEWIDTASLLSRINFAAAQFADASQPGVRWIIERIKHQGTISPEELVDACLDLLGPLEVTSGTRNELIEHANRQGGLSLSSNGDHNDSEPRITEMLNLVVATREYQFA